MIWTYDRDRVSELKNNIADQIHCPAGKQHLLNEGRSLQKCRTMQEYNIKPGSTIILNMRLRGGAESARTSSQSKGSFKEAVKGKGKNPTVVTEPPGLYIVDQTSESPSISIEIPEVNNIYSDLQKNAVICRFNGFWPRTDALYQWIHSVWTKNCQIYLYSKGFFIVCFHTEEEKEVVLNQGPWFWGSAGLFITPWFPDFDANTMVVSRMPVWVRMHNLPLHFWHSKALIAIGNTLGRMLKIDGERHLKGIFTFARICVKVDLSRGLPESIILNLYNTQWKQPLDYENIAFRCRGCQQTGHLYNACPNLNKSKQQQRNPKGWQNIDAAFKKATTAKEKDQDNKDKEINEGKEQEPQLEISGKRSHSPEGSDSDKEQPTNTMENQLAIIDSTPNMDGWRKV